MTPEACHAHLMPMLMQHPGLSNGGKRQKALLLPARGVSCVKGAAARSYSRQGHKARMRIAARGTATRSRDLNTVRSKVGGHPQRSHSING